MNKKEALKQIEEQRDMILELHGWGVFGYIKGIINQLDEPQKIELPKVDFKKSQKVKVPQCVADWISFVKTNGLKFKNTYGFYEEIAPSDDVYRIMYYIFKESIADKGIRKWVVDNIDTFARAWLDGYEVEKEKRYLVKVKGMNRINGCLAHNKELATWYFGISGNSKNHRTNHTRKQLEEAGFGWVFDCPGIEIEEVKE